MCVTLYKKEKKKECSKSYGSGCDWIQCFFGKRFLCYRFLTVFEPSYILFTVVQLSHGSFLRERDISTSTAGSTHTDIELILLQIIGLGAIDQFISIQLSSTFRYSTFLRL